jgi:hypothetical protein
VAVVLQLGTINNAGLFLPKSDFAFPSPRPSRFRCTFGCLIF